LALPAVKQSVVADFEAIYLNAIEKAGSYCWENSIS
jgi:hypothetical protein